MCSALRVVRIKRVKPHLELNVAHGQRSCQQLCKGHGGRGSGLCSNESKGCSVRVPEQRAIKGSLSPPVQPPSRDAAAPPSAPSTVPPFGPSGYSTAPPGVLPGRAPQPFQARLHPSDESRWTHRALTRDGGAKAPPLHLVLGHRHE